MGQASSAFRASALRTQLGRHARAGVPKYIAIRDAIVRLVTGGYLPVGTRLPTESEWVTGLQLSLGTIQRALRLLVEDGVIVRKHGTGSFIAERGVGRMHAPLHCRFLDDSGLAYLPVFAEVIARYRTRADGPWSRQLGVSELICIERVLRIGNEFKVFSRFYADPKRLPAFASLSTRKLSGENFKEIIWRESHHPIGRLDQFLTTCPLPALICKSLGVRQRSAGELLEIRAFVGRDSPIYFQELYIPPNRRRLHLPGDGKDRGIIQPGALLNASEIVAA
jgi:GntR family transcriptional regulator